MNFKPMLATDATKELDNIKYPKYASMKLDGIRCVFHPDLGMVSRSLKPIQNKQLQDKFKVLTEEASRTGLIRDGELYGHKLTFQEITSACMTQDFYDEKTHKKLLKQYDGDKLAIVGHVAKLITQIEFYQFDHVDPDRHHVPLKDRINFEVPEGGVITFVSQNLMHSKEEVESLFKTALDQGFEGLILRDPVSPYKFGRSTLKEEFMLKIKPFDSFDTKIIGVVQSTEVNADVEKTKNELGRSVTSKKKDDRHLIEKASAFWVMYDKHALKVSLAMTDAEKEEVWKNRQNYIGRMIEYKGMKVGAKDCPRHPVFVRFREDRD